MKRNYIAGLCSMTVIACLMTGTLTGCSAAENTGTTTEVVDSVKESSTPDSTGSGKETGSGEETTQTTAGEETFVTAASVIDVTDIFTDRDLSGEYSEADAQQITLSEGDVTITEEGVYLLSGTLTDGMIIVDAEDSAKVQLVLDGVEIHNSSNAAIYVKNADKVFITLAEGSENSLSSESYTTLDDNNIDAVIFSKEDLVLNGSGSLTIDAAQGHGIVSKDDLKVTGGSIEITAASHGLSGKDSVAIADGTLEITAGKDGIHAENDEDTEKGYVYIADGTIKITADGDGISAGSAMQLDGGSFTITAGGGSQNTTVATDDTGDSVSTKGIKAAGELVIHNGSFQLDSQDDAIHSNGAITVQDGSFTLATGDDGIHADETVTIAGGTIEITTSYEGIEGSNMEIAGGTITLYATDDGLNVAGGKDQSGFGGMFAQGEGFGGFGGNPGEEQGQKLEETSGGEMGQKPEETSGEEQGQKPEETAGSDKAMGGMSDAAGGQGSSADSSMALTISGGTLYIHADGDGIDSNGNLVVTGGEVYVSGPEDGGNGALDYDGEGQITGGTLVAVGNSAMAMNFGDNSTQGSILITTTSNHSAGTTVTLQDESGTELVSYLTESDFNSIVISCPELTLGGTYTITAGEESQQVTLSDSLIYGSSLGMGGPGAMPAGAGGNPPELPDGTAGNGQTQSGGTESGNGQPQMPGGTEAGTSQSQIQGAGGNPPEMPQGAGGSNTQTQGAGGNAPQMQGGSRQ